MKINKKYFYAGATALLALALITGCETSTSLSNSTNPEPEYKGVFADAAVQGLKYTCGTRTDANGTTDEDGGFGNCRLKEEVKFFIGDILVGSQAGPTTAPTKEKPFSVTPQSITGDTAAAADGKANILASLLQSLDRDNNASNGVTILPEVATAFTKVAKAETYTSITSISSIDKITEVITKTVTELKTTSTTTVTLKVVSLTDSLVVLKRDTTSAKLVTYRATAITGAATRATEKTANKSYSGTLLNGGLAVGGVNWACKIYKENNTTRQDGNTDDNGTFGQDGRCKYGARVSFKLGTIYLGSLEFSDVAKLLRDQNLSGNRIIVKMSDLTYGNPAKTNSLESLVYGTSEYNATTNRYEVNRTKTGRLQGRTVLSNDTRFVAPGGVYPSTITILNRTTAISLIQGINITVISTAAREGNITAVTDIFKKGVLDKLKTISVELKDANMTDTNKTREDIAAIIKEINASTGTPTQITTIQTKISLIQQRIAVLIVNAGVTTDIGKKYDKARTDLEKVRIKLNNLIIRANFAFPKTGDSCTIPDTTTAGTIKGDYGVCTASTTGATG